MMESLVGQFNALRHLVEIQAPSPAVVVITAATENDGTGLAAFGIANSLAAAGHRTLMIRATGVGPAERSDAFRKIVDERRAPRQIGDHGLWATDAGDLRIDATAAHDTIVNILRNLRNEYTYVVIDAGALPNRTLASVTAGIADATLIALCTGRKKCAGDVAVSKAIETTQMNVLGVVATTRAAIGSFKAFSIPEHVAKPRFVGMANVPAGV